MHMLNSAHLLCHGPLPGIQLVLTLQLLLVQPVTDEDPLDAFMAAEVLPEVKEKEQEEIKRRQDEKRLMAKQLAVSGQPLPGLSYICNHWQMQSTSPFHCVHGSLTIMHAGNSTCKCSRALPV